MVCCSVQDREIADRKVRCYQDIDKYEILFPRCTSSDSYRIWFVVSISIYREGAEGGCFYSFIVATLLIMLMCFDP